MQARSTALDSTSGSAAVLDAAQAALGAVLAPKAEEQRVGHLVRTIEAQVIPRLVQARRPQQPAAVPVSATPGLADLNAFVRGLMEGNEAGVQDLVQQLRRRGMSVEAIYLELLAPAACALGSLWDQDLCDFPGVTVAAGRLQRMLRELSPDFEAEAARLHTASPVHRRVLLAQPPQEQHSFGLSMVATFFRREGWLVEGGVGTATVDPALRTQTEWFDAVGFSIGCQNRLDWLHERITAVRLLSRNPAIVVLVGGPLMAMHPQWVERVGADACTADARDAPALAARLIAAAGALAAR